MYKRQAHLCRMGLRGSRETFRIKAGRLTENAEIPPDILLRISPAEIQIHGVVWLRAYAAFSGGKGMAEPRKPGQNRKPQNPHRPHFFIRHIPHRNCQNKSPFHVQHFSSEKSAFSIFSKIQKGILMDSAGFVLEKPAVIHLTGFHIRLWYCIIYGDVYKRQHQPSAI